jgi:hypothetical protein
LARYVPCRLWNHRFDNRSAQFGHQIKFNCVQEIQQWDIPMSDHARKFLEHWKSEHIEPVPDTHRLREAVRLVAMCREEATCAGIPPQELRTAAGDDLIRNMLAALAAAGPPRDKAKDKAKVERKSILHRFLAHIPRRIIERSENVIRTG